MSIDTARDVELIANRIHLGNPHPHVIPLSLKVWYRRKGTRPVKYLNTHRLTRKV